MRIKFVDDGEILFDNGNRITCYHDPECCEWNYADFENLDDIARNTDFDENLDFEFVEDAGFRFGNKPYKMFFVPCYSEQNGFYSCEITIRYNGEDVLSGSCQEIYS